ARSRRPPAPPRGQADQAQPTMRPGPPPRVRRRRGVPRSVSRHPRPSQRHSTTAVGVRLTYDGRSRSREGVRRVISYFQAIVIGLLQGVTELFPISSLGHSVLVPAWLGWDHLVTAQSADESFYLAFVVALHVATALALLVYF